MLPDWMLESLRTGKGLESDDTSKDDDIIKEVTAGNWEKLSKSKHMNHDCEEQNGEE